MEEAMKADQILSEIQGFVNEEVSYIDALVYYAETNNLEIDLIGEIIRRSPVLKSKVRDDAERLNMVERSSKLPI
jgi:hypothetical protein